MADKRDKPKLPPTIAEVRDSQLVRKASAIYKQVYGCKKRGMDEDAIFDKILEENRQFFEDFPQVINLMVMQNIYDKKVFRAFLGKIRKNPWANPEQKLESFALYSSMLYHKANKGKVTKKDVEKFRRDQEKQLKAQLRDYKANMRKVTDDVDKKYKELDDQRIDEILGKRSDANGGQGSDSEGGQLKNMMIQKMGGKISQEDEQNIDNSINALRNKYENEELTREEIEHIIQQLYVDMGIRPDVPSEPGEDWPADLDINEANEAVSEPSRQIDLQSDAKGGQRSDANGGLQSHDDLLAQLCEANP